MPTDWVGGLGGGGAPHSHPSVSVGIPGIRTHTPTTPRSPPPPLNSRTLGKSHRFSGIPRWFRSPFPLHEPMPIHGRGCGGPPGRRTLGTGWCRRGRSHAASAEKGGGGNRLVVWKRTVTGIDPPPCQRSQCHGSVSSTRRDGFLGGATPRPRKLRSAESPWLPSGSAGGARKRTKKRMQKK